MTPIVGQSAIVGPVPPYAAGALGMFAAAPLVEPGTGYDGVVRIDLARAPNSALGSGALIKTGVGQGFGHHILTAAHVINPLAPATVIFTLPRSGYAAGLNIPIGIPADPAIQVYHALSDPDPSPSIQDIGIIKLVDPKNPLPNNLLVAPFRAQQFELYTGTDEVGTAPDFREVTMVGYGKTGAGVGDVRDDKKRLGRNTIDMDGKPWKDAIFLSEPGLLSVDFDNGLAANDYLGRNYGRNHLGLREGNPGGTGTLIDAMFAPGDSGGPWFLGGKIAAIGSVYTNLPRLPENGGVRTDIDAPAEGNLRPFQNASFGELAGGTRMSYYADSFIHPIVN